MLIRPIDRPNDFLNRIGMGIKSVKSYAQIGLKYLNVYFFPIK